MRDRICRFLSEASHGASCARPEAQTGNGTETPAFETLTISHRGTELSYRTTPASKSSSPDGLLEREKSLRAQGW